mmetsp:Transcript_57311/g.153482  ORF Transcript_57311/g.153482 Transcript_57311/m.153482 type:complete len:310 (+) Transcript_57311:1925-2854(+)
MGYGWHLRRSGCPLSGSCCGCSRGGGSGHLGGRPLLGGKLGSGGLLDLPLLLVLLRLGGLLGQAGEGSLVKCLRSSLLIPGVLAWLVGPVPHVSVLRVAPRVVLIQVVVHRHVGVVPRHRDGAREHSWVLIRQPRWQRGQPVHHSSCCSRCGVHRRRPDPWRRRGKCRRHHSTCCGTGRKKRRGLWAHRPDSGTVHCARCWREARELEYHRGAHGAVHQALHGALALLDLDGLPHDRDAGLVLCRGVLVDKAVGAREDLDGVDGRCLLADQKPDRALRDLNLDLVLLPGRSEAHGLRRWRRHRPGGHST